MICERGGCGGNKPEPPGLAVLALFFGVSGLLALFQFAGPLLK